MNLVPNKKNHYITKKYDHVNVSINVSTRFVLNLKCVYKFITVIYFIQRTIPGTWVQ